MKENTNLEQIQMFLRFIEEVKTGNFGEVAISDNPLPTRSDEPTICTVEQEESTFLSFCN